MRKQLNINLDERQIDSIDKVAQRLGLTRTDLIKRCLGLCYHELRFSRVEIYATSEKDIHPNV